MPVLMQKAMTILNEMINFDVYDLSSQPTLLSSYSGLRIPEAALKCKLDITTTPFRVELAKVKKLFHFNLPYS